jgi:hypothetical protein
MNPTTILETAKYRFDVSLEAILEQIDIDCSHYLTASTPLFKQLPSTTNDAQKVKLRHRRPDQFHEQFNRAFEVSKLYERSLTCYTTRTRELEEGYDWFAIYPPNGFRYFYNPACSDINHLRDIDPQLLKQVVDIGFLSERLQSHTHLDPEVILFDMSAYYAIRVIV